jgi:hypothetical protein
VRLEKAMPFLRHFLLMKAPKGISVDFVDPILATDVEATVARLDRTIKQTYPQVQRIFIEVETWRTK